MYDHINFASFFSGSKLKGSNDAEGSEIDDDDDDNDEEEGSQFDDLPDMSGDDFSGDDIGEDEFSDVEDVEFSDDGEPVEDSDGLLEDIKKKTLSFRVLLTFIILYETIILNYTCTIPSVQSKME